MARIVVVCQFFPPEPFSGANRISSLADALAETNDVVVVTLRPSYPDPALYDVESVRKVDAALTYRVRRVFALQRYPRSLLRRALREQVMALRLALAAVGVTPVDAVVTSSPSMFLGPSTLLAARLRSAFFAWDIRDITWQLAGETFASSLATRVGARLLERLMWWTARHANLILAATEGAIDILVAKGVRRERILYVPNAISGQLVETLRSAGTTTEKNRPRVSYVGLLGYPQGLGVLLHAAKEMPGVDFVLAGDGTERKVLEDRTSTMGLENVTFTGFLTREEVGELYRSSDILFAQLKDSPTLNSATIPSKLFEYMAVGKPFVYGGKGLAAELLREIGCAVTVPPDDPLELVRTLRDLLENPDRMRELGEKGAQYVESNLRREDLMHEVAIIVTERVGSKH